MPPAAILSILPAMLVSMYFVLGRGRGMNWYAMYEIVKRINVHG